MRPTKKQEFLGLINRERKVERRLNIEISKNFKTCIINMFQELKEAMFKK